MKNLSLAVGTALLCFSGLSCGSTEVVPIQLSFNSQNTFLFSDSGRVMVFEPGSIDCLETTRIPSERPIRDTGVVDLCEFYDGSVVIEDLPEGELEFLFVGLDEEGTGVLLHGCTRATRNQSPLELQFRTTQLYEDRTKETTLPDCPSVEARCTGACR